MAEKYGQIPKRFTKDWYDYVWTYYKWHIIIPLFVIVFALVTIHQCTNRVQYDLDVYYAGNKVFSAEQTKLISDVMSAAVDDVNDDGERLVNFQQINFKNTAGMEEMNYNLQAKLDLQLQRRKAYIFIFDREETELMMGRENLDLIYTPVNDWAKTTPSDDKLYVSEDGNAYAVYIGSNERVKSLGINTDDLYLVLRLGEGGKNQYSNAVKLANYLLGE